MDADSPSGPIEPAPRRIRASDRDRDAVLDVLAAAHASGRLDPFEVDERQTAVVRAKFLDALLDPIADLPEGAEVTRRIETQPVSYTHLTLPTNREV